MLGLFAYEPRLDVLHPFPAVQALRTRGETFTPDARIAAGPLEAHDAITDR